ncbi:MAG: sigma-70 family RNA polymerase sigma factor [Saprospiraceae bacterium]|nr:sigma-70 family RNA polymerase sigma factor [Saprospiraceae bacterium]
MIDWIQKIKTNENEAIKEIYMLCKSECLQWLQKEYNCTKDDAMDIFQLSIMILYDNIKTQKLKILTSNLKTYVFGIARNKALELHRSRQIPVTDDYLSFVASYVIDEDNNVNEDQINMVCQSLDELGDPCKTVLVQYYYHDKSMDEITLMMSYKNADTTKNQKYKCLKRLQNIYFSHKQKSIKD